MAASSDHSRPKSLVCFAVKEEAAGFQKASSRGGIETLITGMGARQAKERLVRWLVSNPAPEFVFSCGFAGGLNPQWEVGTVLFDTFGEASLAQRLRAAGAFPAVFHCAERVAITAKEKRDLWNLTRADAVEMESSGIRAVCLERQIPSAIVRAISDAASQDLPLDFNRFMDGAQRFRYGKLAVFLLGNTRKIRELARFRRELKRAAKALGTVLERAMGE